MMTALRSLFPFKWNDLCLCISLILFSSYFLQTRALTDGIFFLIERPTKLNYIYQINPSYHIGAKFPDYVIEDIGLVYAEPSDGCTELENADFVNGEVVLMERGECPFVVKVKNAQKAGARIALVTDSAAGTDDFIDMVLDETNQKADIPAAYLPGVSGKRIREYLVYEKPIVWIQIPLNYTTKAISDEYNKPPWELW